MLVIFAIRHWYAVTLKNYIKQRTSRRSGPESAQPILSEAKGGVIRKIGVAILSLKTKRMQVLSDT
jgi:hypothetical protein